MNCRPLPYDPSENKRICAGFRQAECSFRNLRKQRRLGEVQLNNKSKLHAKIFCVRDTGRNVWLRFLGEGLLVFLAALFDGLPAASSRALQREADAELGSLLRGDNHGAFTGAVLLILIFGHVLDGCTFSKYDPAFSDGNLTSAKGRASR